MLHEHESPYAPPISGAGFRLRIAASITCSRCATRARIAPSATRPIKYSRVSRPPLLSVPMVREPALSDRGHAVRSHAHQLPRLVLCHVPVHDARGTALLPSVSSARSASLTKRHGACAMRSGNTWALWTATIRSAAPARPSEIDETMSWRKRLGQRLWLQGQQDHASSACWSADGELITRVVPTVAALWPLICDHVLPGTTLHRRHEMPSYRSISVRGYHHMTCNHRARNM